MEKNQRVSSLDAIRGFSLLGILLANLFAFQYGVFGAIELGNMDHSTADWVFYYITKIFIEGSFMPIFAFIFGYSVILMKKSLERNNLGVKRHISRRAIALIILGLLHLVFLWEGDILFTYGLMLLFLLFFVNRKPRTLLVWGVIGFTLLFAIGLFSVDLEPGLIPAKKDEYLAQASEVYGSGTYVDILWFENLVIAPIEITEGQMALALVALPILILPLFIIGMYAANRQWLQSVEKVKRKYFYLGLVLSVIGILFKMTMFQDAMMDLSLIGANILAFGYICLFAYGYSRFSKLKIMTAFENVGKLSLSNYLLQSFICSYIFYGYGFGLFERMGIMNAFLLGIVIFIIQLIGSTAYLYCFNQGPFEKIMRFFVYLKLFKRKRKTAETVELEESGS